MPSAPNPGPTARKRRLFGWTLLTTALLLAAIFTISRWSWFGYVAPGWSLWFSYGEITISVPAWNIFGFTGLQAKAASARISWTWIIDTAPPAPNALVAIAPIDTNFYIARYRVFGRGNTFLDILLWPPALAAFFASAALLHSAHRAQRRASIGLCPNCGYNLTGLTPDAPCPECGTVHSKM